MRPLLLQFALICLFTFSANGLVADSSIESKIDDLLEPLLQEDLISGSILIAKDGEILFAKGYGPANREYALPNTPKTKFRIGSMTKQFTAAAIFLLQQDGLLNIDDTLDRYLPDFPNAERITLHQLLTHTSGVPSYNAKEDYHEKLLLPWTVNEVVTWFQNDSLLFEPGTAHAYSNSGYVLLAAVIEKVADTDYPEFLKQRIFDPIGMIDSGQDHHTSILINRANGHGNDGEIYQAPYRDLPFTSGAGSLYSTVLDLFRWDRVLYTNELLLEDSREQMFTPALNNYACGWFVDELFGRPCVFHGGAINGFLANIQRFIDDGVLVVSLFKYETTFWRSVDRALAAIALGEEYEPVLNLEGVQVDSERLAGLAGRYEIAPDYLTVLSVENGHLMAQAPEETPAEGVPQSESRVFFKKMNTMIDFRFDEEGRVEGLVGLQGANRFTGRKVE